MLANESSSDDRKAGANNENRGSFNSPQKDSLESERLPAESLEYARLPHGFQVRDSGFVEVFSHVVEAVRNAAHSSGFQTLILPSVGFASTFERGADTTGEKTFGFLDRKGRRIMLSPDSTPGIFRWYLENFPAMESLQTAWLAPVFRYRHTQNRGFHQFGVASINDPQLPAGMPDLHLAEATNFMLNLFDKKFGIRLTVQVTNVGAIRKLLSKAVVNPDHAESILSELHSIKDLDARQKKILSVCPNSAEREALLYFLKGENPKISVMGDNLVKGVVAEMNMFSAELRNFHSIELKPGELHSSQILSGLGVRFISPNGSMLGDGGRYDHYGRNYNDKIQSVVSVCSGIEAVYRELLPNLKSQLTDFTMVVFPDCAHDAFAVADSLRDAGLSVEVKIIIGALGKAIRQIADKSHSFAVFGSSEQKDRRLTLVLSQCRKRVEIETSKVEDYLLDIRSKGWGALEID